MLTPRRPERLSAAAMHAQAAAQAAGLPTAVVPGILCASLFPAIIGSRLARRAAAGPAAAPSALAATSAPARTHRGGLPMPVVAQPGTVYLTQDLRFRNPALVGRVPADHQQSALPRDGVLRSPCAAWLSMDSAFPVPGDSLPRREALRATVRVIRLSGQRRGPAARFPSLSGPMRPVFSDISPLLSGGFRTIVAAGLSLTPSACGSVTARL